ncbi:MAG: hypothetical protein R6X02_32020 [Enhygromyxa sp.]
MRTRERRRRGRHTGVTPTMAPKHMPSEERDALLSDLRQIAADADLMDPSVFLPLARHDLALRPENLIIRGERGAGKTALFRFITAHETRRQELRDIFPNSQLVASTWIDGFSVTEGMNHPVGDNIWQFAKAATDSELRIFWMAHLACRLHATDQSHAAPPSEIWEPWSTGLNDVGRWVHAAVAQLVKLTTWLDELERHLAGRRGSVMVMYDQLDRISPFERDVATRCTNALLALWMSLIGRYRRLHAKIFIREDFFEASQRSFADASKLQSRSISLDWDRQSLFRVLIRHMACRSDGLRGWLGRGGKKIPLKEHPFLGWMPPDTLPEKGKVSQKTFVEHLVGETMGKGIKKGYTHNWIPNRLQDAHVRIVPRSLLNLIGLAADQAKQKGPTASYDRLLTPGELAAALEETSRRRVRELAEEHPVVQRLENLRDQTVMLEPKVVVSYLSKPVGDDDDFATDGQRVLEEFVRLGILSVRKDGRVDVPDIYRYGFGIKRKGGVKRPR